jgi:hypothetical protein
MRFFWRTALDDLREQNRRLWEHVAFLEKRNQELHENSVRMHKIGAEALEAEMKHAEILKQIEADGARLDRGLRPRGEEALLRDDGETADFSRVPGGDLPTEGDGGLM